MRGRPSPRDKSAPIGPGKLGPSHWQQIHLPATLDCGMLCISDRQIARLALLLCQIDN